MSPARNRLLAWFRTQAGLTGIRREIVRQHALDALSAQINTHIPWYGRGRKWTIRYQSQMRGNP